MLSGVAEAKIRVVGGDIGGGFGNKVPIYPGYVVATVASIVTGVPIKVDRSRIDNLSTTGFARDYHGIGELAADADGRIKGLPSRRWPTTVRSTRTSRRASCRPGCSRSARVRMAIPNACRVDAVYTNRRQAASPPLLAARVTEAVYLIDA